MIIYTGTHDNDTVAEWYKNLGKARQRKVRRFLKKQGLCNGSVISRLITYVLKSRPEYAVISMPDLLGLGSEGHINTPGTVGSPDWEWRMPDMASARKAFASYKKILTSR